MQKKREKRIYAYNKMQKLKKILNLLYKYEDKIRTNLGDKFMDDLLNVLIDIATDMLVAHNLRTKIDEQYIDLDMQSIKYKPEVKMEILRQYINLLTHDRLFIKSLSKN